VFVGFLITFLGGLITSLVTAANAFDVCCDCDVVADSRIDVFWHDII
jgi:hypothetical protein